MELEKAKLCAKYDVGWWKAHGRRELSGVLENMTNLYLVLFNGNYATTAQAAKGSVELRAAAGKEHDLAEELERSSRMEEANEHWQKVEDLLVKSYALL